MFKRGVSALVALLLSFLIFGLVQPAFSAQAERILDFHSRIQVHQDGSMTVTENIRVVCAGKQIKRGIYRDFPSSTKDRYGNTVRVGFEVVTVLRDDHPAPYHIKQLSNGERVYIGQKKVFLRPAIYTYTITYRAYGQLGFFRDFDELYWNVTGNGWGFVINRAEAVIELPLGADILNNAAYTGRYGGKGQDFTTGYDEQGNISFTTTRPLMPKEGLTIAVAWPKGIVTESTFVDKLRQMNAP